jgi:hypothetical protein
VFGLPFREFESFEQGLMRYRMNLANNEQEKQELAHGLVENEAIHIEFEPVERKRTFSETDKFALAVKLGKPLL